VLKESGAIHGSLSVIAGSEVIMNTERVFIWIQFNFRQRWLITKSVTTAAAARMKEKLSAGNDIGD
jgi:hypothetical protein